MRSPARHASEPDRLAQSPVSQSIHSPAVLGFGALTAAAIVLTCFFVPRRPGMEEVGVYNAVYTYAHFGKMAFPIYGLDFLNSFGIHPHLHYAILAWLLKLGFSLYSSEAVIISTTSVIAILLILISKFPDPVKLGFLLGLYGDIVLAVRYMPDHAGIRPELHVSIAWFAGLVALESSRLANWSLPKLCLGAALVTYASAMQNYALLAPAAVAVYAAWMLFTLSRRQALPKIVAALAAVALVAIPFVLLYVMPNWQMMRANMNWGTTHSAPLGSKLAAYFDVYMTQIVPSYQHDLFSALFAIAPLLGTLLAHIPLPAATLVLLLILPATRGMAFAFLPVPLLAMLTLPKSQYFISEQLIFLAAFWSAILSGMAWLASTIPGPYRATVLLSVVCAALLIFGSPSLASVRPWNGSPLHEMDLERATARLIVGPNALVASRHLGWYISGGSRWFRLESALTEPLTLDHFDANRFARQFDAIADYPLFSWQSQNGNTPSTMYVSGAIHLKGFYLAQRMPGLSLLIYHASKPDRVLGFLLRNDSLQRFDQDDSGSFVFVTALGPRDQARDIFASLAYELNILDLPGLTNAVSAYLVPRSVYQAKQTTLPPGFRIVDSIAGRLSDVNANAMLASSRATDRTIQFLRSPLEDTLTAFLATADHPSIQADDCAASGLTAVSPVAPISSGSVAPSFQAANVFDSLPSTWASERLGPTTKFVSFIGADFGPNQQIELRAIGLEHSPDQANSISSAILMSADSFYDWRPVATLNLRKDAAMHTYCIPASGAHRLWKLVAAENPGKNHAWQIQTLRFSH